MGRPRDYWKKLNELVTDYLVGIQPVYNNPSDDARIPEQWRSGLKEKIVEVNQRQKKDWKKNLAAKKADAIVWLGEEATEHLFRALE
jgi:NADH:ubiquinone oxidoreductase subunit